MKKLLCLLCFASTAQAQFEGKVGYTNNAEVSFMYNYGHWFPQFSYAMNNDYSGKSLALGAGFKYEMLVVDFQAGYDFNKAKAYSDFSTSTMQQIEKVGIGFGVTKRHYYTKKEITSENLFPKLLLSYSL